METPDAKTIDNLDPTGRTVLCVWLALIAMCGLDFDIVPALMILKGTESDD